jgi:hypothetical protein
LLNPPAYDDHGVAASADGIRIYAVGYAAGVYESSDGGETWSTITGTYFSGACTSVACSANGKIVYVEPGSGMIEKSTDYGTTWANTTTAGTGQAISCTADGNTLITGNVACSGNGVYRAKLTSGAISLSINSGSSFNGITGPGGTVSCLAASSDCTRLLAGVNNGLLYASANQGVTWTPVSTISKPWSGAWMSADGSKFGAAASASTLGGSDGGVYSASVAPQPNTISTGSTITGSQGSAVELQYIGGSQFIPVGSSGLLWSN